MNEEPENEEPKKKRKAADLLRDRGDLVLADQMRLMADNQATLDRCNEHDRKVRDLDMRVAEVIAKGKYEGMEDDSPEGGIEQREKDMKILLNSPTTTNVYQIPKEEKEERKEQTPSDLVEKAVKTVSEEIPRTEKKSSEVLDLLKKAAVTAALVGSGAGGVAIPWVISSFNKTDKPVEQPIIFEDTRMDIEIEKFVPEREGFSQ